MDATPRRLVVQASGVPERTPDRNEVVKGPACILRRKSRAWLSRRSRASTPSQVKQAGNYFELHKTNPWPLPLEMLAESLPAAILGIQWPKTMYWTGGKTGPRLSGPSAGSWRFLAIR